MDALLNLFASVLVLCLGSDSFRVREPAHRWLDKYAVFAPVAIEAGKKGNLEQRLRCEMVWEHSRQANLEWLLEFYKPPWGWWPWIECWPKESPLRLTDEVRAKYLALAAGHPAATRTTYPASENATRLLCRDLFREGRMDELEFVLRMLMNGSRRWLLDNGQPIPD